MPAHHLYCTLDSRSIATSQHSKGYIEKNDEMLAGDSYKHS